MKKIIKGKKGTVIFSIFLVVIAVSALTLAFVSLKKTKKSFEEHPVGQRQFELLGTVLKGEKALFFIDQAAKYSAYQSIYDLSRNSGYGNTSQACGSYAGKALWQNKSKSCLPEDLDIAFSRFFNKNMNSYLNLYPLNIPKNNYDVMLSRDKLLGFATQNLVVTQPLFKGIEKDPKEDPDNKLKSCTTGGCVAELAEHYVELYSGFPYVWGGESPYSYELTIKDKYANPDSVFKSVWISKYQPPGSPRAGMPTMPGFDCSGFLWWIGYHAQVPLFAERLTAQGYLERAKELGYNMICSDAMCTEEFIKKNAEPGDVLFINPCDRGVCHIALYVGNGEIVESIGGLGPVKRKIPENYYPGGRTPISSIYRPEFTGKLPIVKTEEKKQAGIFDNPAETAPDFLYALKPSFTVSIDYDFKQDYDKIKEALRKINELCKDNVDCVADALKNPEIGAEFSLENQKVKPTGYNWIVKRAGEVVSYEGDDKSSNTAEARLAEQKLWKEHCEAEAETALNDFLGLYSDCLFARQEECYCELPLKAHEKKRYDHDYVYNFVYDFSKERYNITLTNPNTHSLNATFEPNITADYLITKLEIKKDKYKVFLESIGGSSAELESENITLYKRSIPGIIPEEPERTVIDFVKRSGTRRTGKDKVKFAFSRQEVDLPEKCEPTRFLQFCVISNKKLLAKDRITGEVKELAPAVRFSYYYRDTTPPAKISDVSVVDKQRAKKSVIVMWKQGSERDIEKYKIYYSKQNLEFMTTEEINEKAKKQSNLAYEERDTYVKEIPLSEPMNQPEPIIHLKGKPDITYMYYYPSEGLRLYVVRVDEDGKEKYYLQQLEKGKTYNFTSAYGNYFVHVLEMPEDGVKYYFAVTAVDKEGNEILNDFGGEKEQRMQVVVSGSVDDTPPRALVFRSCWLDKAQGSLTCEVDVDAKADYVKFLLQERTAEGIVKREVVKMISEFKKVGDHYKVDLVSSTAESISATTYKIVEFGEVPLPQKSETSVEFEKFQRQKSSVMQLTLPNHEPLKVVTQARYVLEDTSGGTQPFNIF